jgi:hypothetical protein
MVAFGLVQAARVSTAAKQAYWKPIGRPCLRVSRQDLLALGLPMHQVFEFQTLRIVRVAGGAFCSGESESHGLAAAVATGATVCQLANPIAFSVVASGQEYDFHPGVATPATVTVRDGALTCVLASNFKSDD